MDTATTPSRYMPSSLNFLSLPKHIRQRIYQETDLPRDCDIDLHRHLWPESKCNGKGIVKIPNQLPENHTSAYNLLLTCRTIYVEAAALVYSTNRFFIRYREARSLGGLMNLTKTSLSSLTHLEVHLSITSCDGWDSVYGFCCQGKYPTTTCRCPEHDHPLEMSSVEDSAILLDWQRAACYIAAHIQPLALNFYFICDVEDLETGRLAVQPLQNFPILADCHVRLNKFRQSELQALAVDAVKRAKGHPPKSLSSTFPFMDLPRELRLQILEYSDLVTPRREVEWNPKENFYLHDACRTCDGRGEDPRHSECRFRECNLFDYEGAQEYRRLGCFCSKWHSASSSECHCWMRPSSLFLVCKTMFQDAQTVFFAKNHFVIAPTTGCTQAVERSPDNLEVLSFLKDKPSSALWSIRSLEIVFPPLHNDYLESHEPAYQQWLEAIELMSSKLNLPTLSLSIAMAEPNIRAVVGRPCRRTMIDAQATKILMMYQRVLEPLSKLKENGLQAFFVSLASPYIGIWDVSSDAIVEARMEFLATMKDEYSSHAKRIERKVMGEDYNSSLFQDKAHRQSGWLASQILEEDF